MYGRPARSGGSPVRVRGGPIPPVTGTGGVFVKPVDVPAWFEPDPD
jgi:hypothetical protein